MRYFPQRSVDKKAFSPYLHTELQGRLANTFEPQYEFSNNVVRATSSKGSDQPSHTRSLIRAFARRLDIL